MFNITNIVNLTAAMTYKMIQAFPCKALKTIKIAKHKFNLEIYPRLVDWEIFPHNYDAALYAFSNKEKLNKKIKANHVYQKETR